MFLILFLWPGMLFACWVEDGINSMWILSISRFYVLLRILFHSLVFIFYHLNSMRPCFMVCYFKILVAPFLFTPPHQPNLVDSKHETWFSLVSFVYFHCALFLDVFPCFWCLFICGDSTWHCWSMVFFPNKAVVMLEVVLRRAWQKVTISRQ